MTNRNDDIYAAEREGGLKSPYVTQKVIAELRAMAAGTDGYERFVYTSPKIKRVWIAAALLIESYQAWLAQQDRT